MEEKKTVEKSGLPIVINGVELTEKDLHCLALHIDEFTQRCWFNDEGASLACQQCSFIEQCTHPESHVVDQWEAIGKLMRLTGIYGNYKDRDEWLNAVQHSK